MPNISKTTQFANRYGLNVAFYAESDASMQTPLISVDFANVSDIEISGDRVWATGGQGHVNKIGFDNPIQGTFKLSTQILTSELLTLMAGGDIASATTTVEFKNTANTAPKAYIVKAETVWQDASGTVYDEVMTFHKALPKKALNISYNGDGDPTSVDIEFDLMENADHKVLTITKADHV